MEHTDTTRFLPGHRRHLLGALVAAGTASAGAAVYTQPGARTPAALPTADPSHALLRERRAPDVQLVDHNGRSQRFYTDIMQGRRVVLSVMYSLCSNICPPSTRNLIEARQLLGKQGEQLRFVSLSLTPLTDTPQMLHAYRRQFGIEGDWIFLTGKPELMERVQRGLGYISDAEGDDLLSHSAMARYCDERYQRWTHINTMVPPRSIARMIRFEMA